MRAAGRWPRPSPICRRGQREAVELLAVRQRSLAEAAEEAGKTKGALKVNLHRALKALRDRFDQAG